MNHLPSSIPSPFPSAPLNCIAGACARSMHSACGSVTFEKLIWKDLGVIDCNRSVAAKNRKLRVNVKVDFSVARS